MRFGTTELIIVLAIILLLFGVGRIGKIAGEMGSGIRAFKKGLEGDEEEVAAQANNDDEVEAHDTHHGESHHGIAHIVPLPILAAIFAALVVLTVVTVAVTSFDFGASVNLTVAMVIATIKATLVIAVFMHLLYDRSINLLLFLTSVLFVVLFISLSMLDRSEYQPAIDELEAAKEAAE